MAEVLDLLSDSRTGKGFDVMLLRAMITGKVSSLTL